MTEEGGVERPRHPHRVHPRLVVALVIVALLVAGVVGALMAGVGRDGDDVTGVGLRPTVDVGHPAGATTAPPAGRPGAGGSGAPGDTGAGGEATTTTSSLVTVAGIDPSVVPVSMELPMPSEPVVLPTFVTVPAPPTTLSAVALDDFDPHAVDGLDGWSVVSRSGDRLTMTDGARVIEVVRLAHAGDATDALSQFADILTDEFSDLSPTPPQRLSAPTNRFTYVSGSQFTAVRVSQQTTAPVTGSAVAGVGPDGAAVVVAALRDGSATADQLAADGAAATAVLAALAP